MSFRKKLKKPLFQLLMFLSGGKRKNQRLSLAATKKVLIIRQDNRMGNMLFITPLIELVHRQTGVKPDIIAGDKFAELLQNNPHSNQVWHYPHGMILHPLRMMRWLKKIKEQNYDLVIDAKNCFSFNNAILTHLLPAQSKIGFYNEYSHHYLDYAHSPVNDGHLHESERLAQPFLRYFWLNTPVPPMKYVLGDQSGVTDINQTEKMISDIFKSAFNSKAHFYSLFSRSQVNNIIGIHIGGRKSKSISTNLVNRMLSPLQQLGYSVVVVYGPDEAEKIKEIDNLAGIIKYAPESADELARFIDRCDIFITPDTGPLHLASALNSNIVALFNDGEASRRYGIRTSKFARHINAAVLTQKQVVSQVVEGILQCTDMGQVA